MLKALALGLGLLTMLQPEIDQWTWLKDPPFLLAEDAAIKGNGEDAFRDLRPSTSIAQDRWLNGPLTRLDYVLMRIEATLAETAPPTLKAFASKYFAADDGLALEPSITAGARYNQDNGRLTLGVMIDARGRPLKPMSEYCERALAQVETFFPLKNVGYGWENGALAALQRRPDQSPEFAQAVEALVHGAAIGVHVSTSYVDDGALKSYTVSCARDSDGAPTRFYKTSRAMTRPGL